MTITKDQLRQICPSLTGIKAAAMADLLNELCPKYGIVDPLPYKMFLANVAQESGEFNHMTENMNYSAERICAVWPSRFKTTAQAKPFARKPEALANEVYGKRMGNNQPGDGWRFRGGGFIGLTGREVYGKYANYIGKEIGEAADLVRSDIRFALDSACWFFAILKNLTAVAQTGDFKKVVRGINGGTIGWNDRVKYYDRVNAVLG